MLFRVAIAAVLCGCCVVASRQLGECRTDARSDPTCVDRSSGFVDGVGIALCGSEFGAHHSHFSNSAPGVIGKDYTYATREIKAAADARLQFVRIPFRWERIQPELGKPLNASELARLNAVVTEAERYGIKILLDLHNYGRYRVAVDGHVIDAVIDQCYEGTVFVSRADFADVWRQLATHFAHQNVSVVYGLMNEPHDMGSSNWQAISQAAVEAIREVDDRQWIVVAGNGWSSADKFSHFNGTDAWISDPAERVAYEAHCYLDHDVSGEYKLSYAMELSHDPELPKRGAARMDDFLTWLERNQAVGVLGEIGVPVGDREWRRLLVNAVDAARERGVPVCLWAAGEWWGDYSLSLQNELVGKCRPVTLNAAFGKSP